jgi:hypothetical protein
LVTLSIFLTKCYSSASGLPYIWQNRITHIIVDEAHCIEIWGQEIRKAFGNLKQLRAVFPEGKVLALTGTASPDTRVRIAEILVMQDVTVVKSSLSRSNIKLAVVKRTPSGETSYDSVIEPFVNELKQKGSIFPKTVMYLRLKWCGHAHELCLRPTSSDDVSDKLHLLIAQFHAPCTDQVSYKKKYTNVNCSMYMYTSPNARISR